MATVEADINPSLSLREATRLVERLQRTALAEPVMLRSVLIDLPQADIDVLRGVLRITKERAKQYGNRRAAVL